MRILIAHNAYLHRGGEDICAENETQALTAAGLTVEFHRVQSSPDVSGVSAALHAPFGGSEEGRLEEKLQKLQPDILHVHNLYPLLSPRVFRIAHERGVKTVLTLHNFRPLCMNGLFMTPQGEVCERCAPGNPVHGVLRGCYRSSLLQSAGMATHLSLASLRHWYDDVDLFIAPSQFLKDKYVSYGFPEKKITVQAHFIPDWPKQPVGPPVDDVLYLGRLADEKGLRWLVELFMKSTTPAGLLNIAGDGPLRSWIERLRHPRIRYLGYLKGEAKAKTLRTSFALVLASRCYESFAMVVSEANSYGVPALVPNHGAMSESVASGLNGERYEAETPHSFWAAHHIVEQKFASRESREALKDWAQQRFSAKSFVKIRTELYQKLISNA